MKKSKVGQGLMLAGQKRGKGMKAPRKSRVSMRMPAMPLPEGSGLVLAGDRPQKRGRGRPRKSDMAGGLSMGSIMMPIIQKTAKKTFSSPKEFGKAIANVPKFVFDKKTWTNAGDFLNDKSVKAERGKFDKLIVKLLGAIPVAGSTLSSKYTDKVINQPVKGDIKGAILEGIKVNDMVKKAVKEHYGITLPKTPMEYLLEGDLDGMGKALEEQKKMEPKILELIAKVSGEQMTKSNLENKDNLWYDPVARKTYYGEEGKKMKEEYLKANPGAVETMGKGMKLSGSGCGCCDMCGRGVRLAGRGVKLAGRGVKLAGRGVRLAGRGGSGNPWLAHVKAYASKHGIKYNQALKEASASYKG